MLRRLFLSIIILSTLASEGGVSYSANLIDYYLVNLTHLDIIQDSRNAISSFDAQEQKSLNKKGTPVAFYKLLSQASINSKTLDTNNHFEPIWINSEAIALSIFITFFIFLYNQISFLTRRVLLNLADSSPPAYC